MKFWIVCTPCSTEIKMAAHEAKLRGPYYGCFEHSSSPKRWRGICEDVSMQDSGHLFDWCGGIRQHASRKMVENGSKAHRGLTKGFEAGRMRVQLSCWYLQSYAHLSSERVAELHAFEGLLSTGELYFALCKSLILVKNSDRTLGFGLTLFERERFSSRLELRPRRKWLVNWSFGTNGLMFGHFGLPWQNSTWDNINFGDNS